MIINIIKNEDSSIKNKIVEMLSKKACDKLVILGSIDDYSLKLFDDKKISKDCNYYISIDKRYTSYEKISDICENNNVYIYNNNLHKQMKKDNIVICKGEEELEVLMSGFEFTKENLDNACSYSMYIKGSKNLEELKDIRELYEYYSSNMGNYLKLDKEELNKLDKNKEFRNSKINTIFNEMEMDEIISSFRNKENAYKNINKKEESFPTDDEIDIEINID